MWVLVSVVPVMMWFICLHTLAHLHTNYNCRSLMCVMGWKNVLALILPGSGPMMQFDFAFEDEETYMWEHSHISTLRCPTHNPGGRFILGKSLGHGSLQEQFSYKKLVLPQNTVRVPESRTDLGHNGFSGLCPWLPGVWDSLQTEISLVQKACYFKITP